MEFNILQLLHKEATKTIKICI